MLPNRIPRVGGISTSSDQIDKPRLAEGVLLYLVSVALVAAAIIVLFSAAATSLLDTSKETLIGSRIDNSPAEGASIGNVVFYTGSGAAPVPAQTESPSWREVNNMPPATLVPQPFGMPGEKTVAEPAPEPPPNGDVSAATAEIPHGSTQGASTDDTPPPELSRSRAAIVQPLSIADEARATEHASGATMPPLATSDQQRDQILQNVEIQRNDHANLEQGSATLTTKSRFPEEPQVKESTGFYGSTARPRSPPLRHAASHRSSAVEADHNITQKLNRAELGRLLKARGRRSDEIR